MAKLAGIIPTDQNNVPLAAGEAPSAIAGASKPASLRMVNATLDGDNNLVGDQRMSFGGISTATVAATTSSDTVIKVGPGRLSKVLVTTLGTAACVIWDNASGHTGTIIGYIAASAAAGTLVDFNMPCTNGIVVQGNANLPAITVSFE